MDMLGKAPTVTTFSAYSYNNSHPILLTNIKKELDLNFIKQDLDEGATWRQPWISDRKAVSELYQKDRNQITLLAHADIPLSNFWGQCITGQSQTLLGGKRLKKEIKDERVDYSSCKHERSVMKSSYSNQSAPNATNNEPHNFGEYSLSNNASIAQVSTTETQVNKSASSPRNKGGEPMFYYQRHNHSLVSNEDRRHISPSLFSDKAEKEHKIPFGRIRLETGNVSNAHEGQAGTGHSPVYRDLRTKTSLIPDVNLAQATSSQLFNSHTAMQSPTCISSPKRCFNTSVDENLPSIGASPPRKKAKIQSETVLDKNPTVPASSQQLQTKSNLLAGTNQKQQHDHPCGRCHMSFHRRRALYNHISLKHPETTFDETHLIAKLNSKDRSVARVMIVGGSCLLYKFDQSSKTRYQCLKCDYGTETRSNMETHLMNHFGIKPYVCRVCQKGFVKAPSLRIHAETHVEAKSHVCKVCGLTFGGLKLLRAHVHGHGDFKCDICNTVYSLRATFKIHMATHDTGVNFLCEYCGETFTNRALLTQHLRRHGSVLEGNQFPCTECGKLFLSKKRHRSHFKLVHQRTVQCEQCNRLFHSSARLETHMLHYHQETMPFVCEKCGKGFRQSHQLKGHAFTHSGEKPYKCKECSAGFTRSDYLRKHQLTHSGEKPYLCNVCGKGFSRKSNLNVHVEYHKRVDSKQILKTE